MRVVMNSAPILEGARVNTFRSQRFALESILRTLAGVATLLVIVVTSSCVGMAGKPTTPATNGASIDLSATTLSFGNLAVGQSATQSVTLSNSGTEMLTISAISVSGTGFTASGPHLPMSLSAGQTASITAAFKPTTGAKETGAITIASNAASSPSMVALTGTGVTGAALTATPASVTFGDVAVGSEETQTVKLENTGGESATITKLSYTGAGVTVTGLTVPATLSAGQAVNLTVTYKPTAAGTVTGMLSLTSNATDSTMQISVSATATTSSLSATPSSVNFGTVAVNSDTTKTIQLQNTGTSQVTISSVASSVASVVVSGITLPLNLAAGKSASFTAAYKPTAAGALSGKITVTSNAVGSPMSISLSGTAAGAAALTATPASVAFGSVAVGGQATQTVKLENTGGGSASITKMSFTGTGVTVTGLTAPATLSAGQSVNLTVTYKPTAAGTLAGMLTLTSNASNPNLQIGLSATATATAATLSVTPSSVSFGSVAVNSDTTKTVQLQNTGTAQVTISSVASSVGSVTVSGITLPLNLAAGKSASFTAAYKPTTAGTLAGKITVTSNAVGSPMSITVSGTAAAASASLTATPASVAFGSVAVGSQATQTVKLANTGAGSASITKMSFTGTGVTVTGLTVPATLSAGQSVNLTVTYKPTAAGTLTGMLSLTSNASNPNVQISLSATATSSTLSATPASVGFGNVVVGSNTTQTIRLQNIGTAQVTISSVASSVGTVVVSGMTLPVSLAPATSATFTAAYKPTTAGTLSGKITVTSNAVGSPATINLSGTAAAATAQLTASATSLSFGSVTVGSSGASQLTVTSTGNQNVSISGVSVSGTGFVLGTSAGNIILDPSQSQAYTVNFNPKAAGSASGTLTITSNAANSPLKIPLAGTGTAAPTSAPTVLLSWDRSTSSVTGYYVYRSTKPSGPYTQLNSAPESSPTYSDATVAAGQLYYYVVTAVDSSNIQSAYSNQVSVSIPAN
jgi:D-Tyr-tRNAtyr deacylase